MNESSARATLFHSTPGLPPTRPTSQALPMHEAATPVLAGVVALGELVEALVVAALLGVRATVGVLEALPAAGLDGGAVAFGPLDEGEVAAGDCGSPLAWYAGWCPIARDKGGNGGGGWCLQLFSVGEAAARPRMVKVVVRKVVSCILAGVLWSGLGCFGI